MVNERKEGRHQVVRHKMVVDKNTPFEKRAKLLSRLGYPKMVPNRVSASQWSDEDILTSDNDWHINFWVFEFIITFTDHLPPSE